LTLLRGNNVLAFNDDVDLAAGNLDSHIDFTATSSGWFTLAVAGFGGNTGDYTLETDFV
jgi:hypothetical protein